ncbi:MAG TPA: PilZ domain-containing protein [Candidatus Acidoferrales bacterium]|nr:PilZ domain-containing protein [Candidatus Acidoferrales bacterium]
MTSAKHSGSGYTDRRSATRYPLALPIAIRLSERAEAVAGTSRDMSVRGVYFTADQEFTRGSVLDVSFTLPAEITEGTEVFVRAQGPVVRVESAGGGGRVGIAMVIEKYEFVRANSEPYNRP